MTVTFLDNRPSSPPTVTLILAHGAGAPMDSPFMDRLADLLCGRGIHVRRFEFPYMAKRREDDRKRPPDREPVLLASWREAILQTGDPGTLLIGGKSMGGRMASLIADDLGVAGLVCLGYPFHPPGKPDRLRTQHLETLRTPAIILQGTRDPFGTPEEAESWQLSSGIKLLPIPDGNHDLKPRVRSGETWDRNLEFTTNAVTAFAGRVLSLSPG